MKTREVDYQQMSTSAIEELIVDYQNEMRAHESRKEWLSQEVDEMQAILDERAQDACEAE